MIGDAAPIDAKGSTAEQRQKLQRATEEEVAWIAARVKEFERVAKHESENREQAVDDLKFKAGEHWPTKIKADREADGRPCLTINMIPSFVNQVVNPQRENRPQIKLHPKGSKSSKRSADMLQGMIRQIEHDCSADVAYDNAYESMVDVGWGYWRVCTEYESEDSFDQCIYVKPIFNTFTVYMDDEHRMPDGSDAKWCFVSEQLKKDLFEKKYPEAMPIHWQTTSQGDQMHSWVDADSVRVVEYYYYEKKDKKLIALSNGWVGYSDEYKGPAYGGESDTGQLHLMDSRETKVKTVKWKRFTSYQILDEKEWDGYCIPIVKVTGNMTVIDNKPVLSGMIRAAKDAMRMYDYWVTAETEAIALQPKAPWVAAEGQIENYESMWKNANRRNQSVLVYRPVALGGKPVPAPARQPPPVMSQGIVTAKMGAREDLKHTTGIYDPSLGVVTNERTGRAIEARQGQVEIGHFHYIDRLTLSLMHTGKILVDLIPKIYDTKRQVSIINEDQSTDRVQIDVNAPQSYTPAQGNTPPTLNPKYGEYDVVVSTGPSYLTKRMEARTSMLEFIKAVPNSGAAIGDLVAKNMDWPGAEEVSQRLAKTLPPNLLTVEKDIPPQAAAALTHMQTQVQQLTQVLVQMQKQLQDEQKDREVKVLGILTTYDAKMAKVQSDVKTQMEDQMTRVLDTLLSHQRSSEERQNKSLESVAKMMLEHSVKTAAMEKPTAEQVRAEG